MQVVPLLKRPIGKGNTLDRVRSWAIGYLVAHSSAKASGMDVPVAKLCTPRREHAKAFLLSAARGGRVWARVLLSVQ